MNAYQFCAEKANETQSGRIVFSKAVVIKFIKTYTDLQPEDFTDEMFKRLRMCMIDFYNDGLREIYNRGADHPAEKIELPKFIFE